MIIDSKNIMDQSHLVNQVAHVLLQKGKSYPWNRHIKFLNCDSYICVIGEWVFIVEYDDNKYNMFMKIKDKPGDNTTYKFYGDDSLIAEGLFNMVRDVDEITDQAIIVAKQTESLMLTVDDFLKDK